MDYFLWSVNGYFRIYICIFEIQKCGIYLLHITAMQRPFKIKGGGASLKTFLNLSSTLNSLIFLPLQFYSSALSPYHYSLPTTPIPSSFFYLFKSAIIT
jgi:hypothetical protein